MAEFQEVCKQWRRMCEHGSEGFACANCKMYSSVDVSICHGIPDEDEAKIIEGFVMAWAAEHPEPVYPTWLHWLKQQGVIGEKVTQERIGGIAATIIVFNQIAYKPIPADIAQKLGIEPKEE